MSYFEAGFTTLGAAANAPLLAIVNSGGAGKPRMRIVEIGFTTNAATLSAVELVRLATLGTAAGTPTPGQSTDDLDTTVPVGQLVAGWSVAPTLPASPVPFRPFVASAVAGAGAIWTWPADRPIIVSPAASGVSGGLALWNFGSGAASALSGWVVWSE